MDIDFDELAAMVELLKDTDFSEFVYEKGDLRIVLTRGGSADQVRSPAPHAASEPTADAPPEPVEEPPRTRRPDPPVDSTLDGIRVQAPMLGTFYRQPKPGEQPFVQVGDVVTPDTVVCIIEVMKLMNSVKAGHHGRVAAILVGDGDLVEHDQPLLVLEPVDA